MLFKDNLPLQFFFVALHVFVGILGELSPDLVGDFYMLTSAVMAFDVVRTRDLDSRAGFYALYIMGFEVVYRIAGTTISYELGKYLCILILLTGVFSSPRKHFPWMFIVLLGFLMPSIFLSQSHEAGRVREMVMFNISGPLTLVFSGFYFYKRPIEKALLLKGLKVAFYPAFALVAVLMIKSSIGSFEFTTLESNPAATGGFGANQVSTVLGWFILLLLMIKILGSNASPWGFLDWVMLGMLLLRGLLSMSRGGMLSAFLALIFAVAMMLHSDARFRQKALKSMHYVVIGLVFLLVVVYYTNSVTNNYLLYRYQGKSTSELATGIEKEDKSLLTGRDEIMKGDWIAFTRYPILGVGYGMAAKYHAIFFGHEAAAHTEYARLLSENGLMGLFYMLIAFVFLPIYFLLKYRKGLTRFVFVAFLIVCLATMFHAAMRLALPGVLYGAALMVVFENKDRRRFVMRKFNIKI